MQPTIEALWLDDDGLVPNNPTLPAVVYRHAFREQWTAHQIEEHFRRNGWSNAWVNGIYPFHHYHATVHEVLGIAAGTVDVQFGGPKGPTVTLRAGDAVLIPAGVGHCRIGPEAGLSVVGAYPDGADWDLVRASMDARPAAIERIAGVPRPRLDPVLGSTFHAPD
jgi:uncharacterized protein YjlB